MTENFDIDKQIESIQREIAEFTQKLFEAQGMLRLALHIKENCKIEALKKDDATSHPTR